MQICRLGKGTFQTWETANSANSEGQPGSQCGHSGVGKVGQMQSMRKGTARSQRALQTTAGILAFPIRKKYQCKFFHIGGTLTGQWYSKN